MNFIDKSATLIASSIRKNNPQAASQAVLFYALSLLINVTLTIIIVIFISSFTNHLSKALLVILCYTLLRIVSGGAHLASSLACCIASSIIFITASHLEYDFFYIGFILNTAALLILLKTAPQGIEGVSRIDKKYYPLLKLISVAIVFSNYYFQMDLLSTAFFIQALHTTKLFENSIHYLERRVSL
ncbi:accessory gene regulator B family protein [Paenibacillus radicis (ex Xue et al. 2023)]|uniref:Accessory gene regulator B family protein n=1 Tax=Paenibacillus radicis (ex Xue et al. 2023) TaxID=2972489 RepID=A0ABT1YE45_9BACL|nr:accessory gene regulator B family protein [Paenibacillus radicis (ex Xue et al. 2023)]MCR8631040.1 accessory gene regulator B family protein [Paenibacillus radicis (ex Xue et al. 2023)]